MSAKDYLTSDPLYSVSFFSSNPSDTPIPYFICAVLKVGFSGGKTIHVTQKISLDAFLWKISPS